jgi:hypothetical protein
VRARPFVPCDSIVADEDGVAEQARAIDDRERGMHPFIRERKSLQKALAKFNLV